MSNSIQVFNKSAFSEITEQQVTALRDEAMAALDTLEQGSGEGNDFLGWLHLPGSITDEQLADIEETANRLRTTCEYVVVIGIGGSYLGAKAAIEALSDCFAPYKQQHTAKVLFAGNNIGEDYLNDLMTLLADRRFGIVVISKSGTTTEPAIAFRLLKDQLEKQVGKAIAAKRIVAITDARKGALRNLATQEGYKTYVIPDNVGGRFSVLTPVGLLPIAIAGFDIKALVAGAVEMENDCNEQVLTYAQTRNALYRAGKKIELLVNFNPKLHYLAEWWKQLYGESEGKDGKGLFPASVDFTADLHSMGQYIQQGERLMLETVVRFDPDDDQMVVPHDDVNGDGLNFLAGKTLHEINTQAMDGTLLAHVEGGVPNMIVKAGKRSVRELGSLIYFFEYACGLSGYLLGVNPFDQPGVEAYKKNMFALLNKPGYEDMGAELRAKLAQ